MKDRKLWKLFITCLMALAILAVPMTVHAEDIYIESLGITVKTKDTPTETVLVDMDNMLTAGDTEAIKAEGTRLGIYNIGLYIEMIDEKNCNQKHANEMAEAMYKEYMPEENSIMIVFSFYKEAEGYYGVHYNVQGELSESKISGIIEGTYHDFKTDSSWIAGSFQQVVTYLLESEYNLIHADEIAAQKKAETDKFYRLMMFVGAGIVAIIIIALIYKIKEQSDNYEALSERSAARNDELMGKLRKKEREYEDLESEKSKLETWRKHALAVDPNMNNKISIYLAQGTAKRFSTNFGSAETLEDYCRMFDTYNGMSDLEKSYVSIDVDTAREKLDELAKEKAAEATKLIEETCSYSDDRHHLDSYNDTLNYYNGLPSYVRTWITLALVNNLIQRQSNAQSDYRSYQHRSSYSHHSSSSMSHSSYGGFHSGTFGGGFHGGH